MRGEFGQQAAVQIGGFPWRVGGSHGAALVSQSFIVPI